MPNPLCQIPRRVVHFGFNTQFGNSGTEDRPELNEDEALRIIRHVESELPDKVEQVIKVRMSALQSQLYKQMKTEIIVDGKRRGEKGTGLSNEHMQLRKNCQQHSYSICKAHRFLSRFLFRMTSDEYNGPAFGVLATQWGQQRRGARLFRRSAQCKESKYKAFIPST
ncbi:hypothetical protein BT96DRAFT_971855 [Gymnopus androsaceus JB14]|uniref:SNF2 N-terminal domain-containing protein n=1 Tax=Gymnopus androsaceus JB14 TaxID=1447944 RepID=A0A6A4ICT2_9AGAR|nr:hypothetical protein BT96DRAFT_971855 [Gymnopus androsaceus JB14]